MGNLRANIIRGDREKETEERWERASAETLARAGETVLQQCILVLLFCCAINLMDPSIILRSRSPLRVFVIVLALKEKNNRAPLDKRSGG